jgi:CHAD domain-containing protein
MQLKLQKKSSLSQQSQQIATTLLREAQRTLVKQSKRKVGERVHTGRKKFKQLRGLLRLIRYGLGDEVYRQENTVLRDSGRPLSDVRDSDVMIETFDKLVEEYKKQTRKALVKKIRTALVKRRTRIWKQVLEKEKAMTKVKSLTKQLQNNIKKWPQFPDEFGVLKKGIRKIYARGQEEMDTAFKDLSDENLHEWRKSVKYLRYQLEFLQDMKPEVLNEMADLAHDLADTLGLDHDLAVLDGLIQSEIKSITSKEKKLLTDLIQKGRSELQKDAKAMGPQLYADTPKQFCKQLKNYWKAWNGRAQKAAA